MAKKSTAGSTWDINIALQDKQRWLYDVIRSGTHRYPFYGGAKGGGKSHAARMIMLALLTEFPGTVGLLIRRTYPELYGNHVLPLFMQFPFMRDWYTKNESVLTVPGPEESKLVFGHAQHEEDIFNYAGREFDFVAVEEVTQFTETMWHVLSQSNRTSKPGISPVMWATGNPGGIGHLWVKRLWIDRDYNEDENPDDYVFLPAKVQDNPALMQADPNYVKVLRRFVAHDPQLGSAYLDGNWDIYPGQFFSNFNRAKIEIDPFPIPPSWPIYGVMDYGELAPTSFGLYTMDPDKRMYRIGEYYRGDQAANQHAQNIKQFVDNNPYLRRRQPEVFIAPPDMWTRRRLRSEELANSSADIFLEEGIVLSQGVDDRINGWRLMRTLFAQGQLRAFKGWNDNFFRTVPALKKKDGVSEDVEKGGEDHVGDEVRYACMHCFPPGERRAGESPVNAFTLEGILAELDARTSPSQGRYDLTEPVYADGIL